MQSSEYLDELSISGIICCWTYATSCLTIFLSDPLATVFIMTVFSGIGYWAHHWDKRAEYLINRKREQIAERKAAKAMAIVASMREANQSESSES
jgi:hypothetical protein